MKLTPHFNTISSQLAFEIDQLGFAYKTSAGHSVQIIQNLNLKIAQGELVAIQGPSGSGKSTLLYLMGAMMTNFSGSVKVMGVDIKNLSDEGLAVLRNQHIGFIFQQFHLLPRASVLENILLPAQYPAEQRNRQSSVIQQMEKAKALADRLGLNGRLEHLPQQLSGGQQQRVAIARALLNNSQIILADEPTGSLDSKTAQQILDILKQASHEEGRTVIVITHDPEIAKQCDRIIHIRDGLIEDDTSVTSVNTGTGSDSSPKNIGKISGKNFGKNLGLQKRSLLSLGLSMIPMSASSLLQNKSRSFLTMIGIIIGIASVLAMITIGSFTKRKILSSYEELGVNTVEFWGTQNWELRATDSVKNYFSEFKVESDLEPLRKVFPEVIKYSPVFYSFSQAQVIAGGKTVNNNTYYFGVSENGLELSNAQLLYGRNFSPYHIQFRSPVCIIGNGYLKELFNQTSPLDQVLFMSSQENSFACRIIGVLEEKKSKGGFRDPNFAIFIPYTYFQVNSRFWEGRLRDFLINFKPGTDIDKSSQAIQSFFKYKYGNSIRISVQQDGVLQAQMNKFLSLFTILLGTISMVSLAVGGIGITNMMLVSVNERFKEIGIRKAFGATNFSIRVQYLTESLMICFVAGLIGLLVGFTLYEGGIFAATKLVKGLEFEWTYDATALMLATFSIFAVGLLSGLTPALKAERLQVIEALRSE